MRILGSLCITFAVATEFFRPDEAKDQAPVC